MASVRAIILVTMVLVVFATEALANSAVTPAPVAVYASYIDHTCSANGFTGQQFAVPLNQCYQYEDNFHFVNVTCTPSGGVHVDVYTDFLCLNATGAGMALTGDYAIGQCLADAEYNFFEWISCGQLPPPIPPTTGDLSYRVFNQEGCPPESLAAQNQLAAETCFPGVLLAFSGSFMYSCSSAGHLVQMNYTGRACNASALVSPLISYPLNTCVQLVGQSPPVWMIATSCLSPAPPNNTNITTTTTTPRPTTTTTMSLIPTTPAPWQLASVTISISFNFDCHAYANQSVGFNQTFISYLSSSFKIDPARIVINIVICGPTFTSSSGVIFSSTIIFFTITPPTASSAYSYIAAADVAASIQTSVLQKLFVVPGLGAATSASLTAVICADGQLAANNDAHQCGVSSSSSKVLEDYQIIIIAVVGAAVLLLIIVGGYCCWKRSKEGGRKHYANEIETNTIYSST